jgi:hypothetical protein
MTGPTFANAQVLIAGTIVATGRRTITAALRAVGLGHDDRYCKYHRVLSRARWSMWRMSKLLLDLLIRTFLSADAPLVIIGDTTLERRQGKKITYKARFHDAARSTAGRMMFSMGIRWLCLCLLVPVPWSTRPWAMPFLAVPVLSEKVCQKLKRPHRTSLDWTALLLAKVRSWQPEREIHFLGDGEYASVELIRTCQSLRIQMVARMRLDVCLYDEPGPQPASKRGPKPKKGTVQPKLTERLGDPDNKHKTEWRQVTIPWCDGEEKIVEIATGKSLWHVQGHDPVAISWVLMRCLPEDKHPVKTCAFFCSDTSVTGEEILSRYAGRWNIEVFFEEVRAHLGFETQRQWSDQAIRRTTPCLFGLFSLVVVMARSLHPQDLPKQETAWYKKEDATFHDALVAVRAHLWNTMNDRLVKTTDNYTASTKNTDFCLIPKPMLDALKQIACAA